jgi:stearoyl-CoA desaturase (delta-9 desaturase)
MGKSNSFHSGRAQPSIVSRLMAPSFLHMQVLQFISATAVVYIFATQKFSAAWWLAALGAYFLTGCIGLTVTLHRSLAHRSFALPKPLEYLFTWFGIVGGTGSSIAWVAMHRFHHQNVDGDDDPHSPEKMGWKLLFSFYDYEFKPSHAKDLLRSRFHLFIHRYYAVLLVAWASALALININLALYCFFVPVFIQITVSNMTSLLTHSEGYRAHDTSDKSVNNFTIAILAWGEGWHNNHHASPRQWRFGQKWWEIDPGAEVIALLGRVGLTRLPHRAAA